MQRNLSEWEGVIPFSIEKTKQTLNEVLIPKYGFSTVNKNEAFGTYTFSKVNAILQGNTMEITLTKQEEHTKVKITNKNLGGSNYPDAMLSGQITTFNDFFGKALAGEDITPKKKKYTALKVIGVILILLYISGLFMK